jgi:flagellar hook-length control protein FliK
MTTDRTSAPTRSTALADRPSSAGRTQAPPSDAFAALLGAVAPKPGDAQVRRDDTEARRNDASDGREDVSKRRDDVSQRHDDASRADRAHHADRRPDHKREDAPRVADKPKAEVIAAPEAPEVTDAAPDVPAAETPAAPTTTPSLFAMQLASPLPPATPEVNAAATAETASLPTFAGQIPASVAAATTAQTAATAKTAATAATPATAETAATAEAPAPATEPQATTGAIALAGLPAEATADTTVPADLDLSKLQSTPADAATPAQDGAVPADASQQQAGGDASSQEQPNTPAPPTVAATAAAAPTAPKVDAPIETVAVAAPAPTPSVTSQAAPAQITTPSVERAVPLSRAVASSGLLIQMAAERGVTHARLNLKPVELGGIEVRLRTSPQGVHALLVADSPEAARMLSSAGEDLRKSLEDRDVTLLSLDVSTSGDQGRDQPAEFTDAFGEAYRPGGWTNHRVSTDDGDLMDSPAPAETTLVLPNGVTVDVLA